MKQLRWGILGAARIARKNWKAICNSGNGIVTLVASREMERAKQFISECQQHAPFEKAPVALDNYEALLASRDVDAVYIPLPTTIRKEWVIRAAQAGKHVLCEKPCAATVADLETMLAACRQHRVQFMDGVMFMHNRRLDQIRAALDDGASVGELRRVDSHFSFLGAGDFYATNIRVNPQLEPLGCLGDLGWYCVRLALWAARWQIPRQVAGRVIARANGAPTAFSGEMIFAGGLSSSFYCSFLEQHQQWANFSGAKGYLRVPDYVLPLNGTELAFEVTNISSRVEGCDFINEPSVRAVNHREPANAPQSAQETNMFRNFAAQVLSGQLNEQWPDEALKTQRVVNVCLDSAAERPPRFGAQPAGDGVS